MSAVPALQPVDSGAAGASLSVLQDVLYDIVATAGADTDGDVPIAEVERFLHAHARKPHSREQFVAFFEAHGLSAHVTPTLLGIDAPGVLQAAAPSQSLGSGGYPPVAVGPAMLPTPQVAPPLPAPPGSVRVAAPVVWGALAALVLAMGAAIGFGYQTLSNLRGELSEARAQGVAQQRALQTLQDRTSDLQAGVSQNGARIANVNDRGILLESLLPMPLDLTAEPSSARDAR